MSRKAAIPSHSGAPGEDRREAVRCDAWLEPFAQERRSAEASDEARSGAGGWSEPYYNANGITLYHADCRLILPHLPLFDLLLTDPPYGIGADTHQGQAKNGWKQYATTGWDKAPPPRWLIEQAIACAKRSVIWGGNYFELPPRMGWLIWDKGQRDFSLADVEMAWTSENKAARAFDYSRARAKMEGKEHQTQKPVPLMQWSIQQMGDVETILDPFAGTGTTGIAARNLGKRCVLIEREEAFCEIIVRRLAQDVLPLAGGAEPVGEQLDAFATEPRNGSNEKLSHTAPTTTP